MKTYNKLVRDKIPEIIKASGKKPTYKVLNEADYKTALLLKLVEEAKECYGTFNNAELTEELADLMEVVYAICETYGITVEQIKAALTKKYLERGGFKERYCLVGVE